MTKSEAKELCLEVWQYFAEHPEIKFKSKLPGDLYDKIEDLSNVCPLCEVHPGCVGCPLVFCGQGSPYYLWIIGDPAAAQTIVDIIKNWEVEE